VQGVGESGRVNYLEGLVFYQSETARSPHVRKFVHQEAHRMGPMWKFDPPWGPNLGDTPNFDTQFWTFLTKDIEGVYKSWKFDRATFKGSGDIEGRITR